MILSGRVITHEMMAKLLALNDRARLELDRIESYSFNVFTLVRDAEKQQLTAIVSHILAKERVFEELPIAS